MSSFQQPQRYGRPQPPPPSPLYQHLMGPMNGVGPHDYADTYGGGPPLKPEQYEPQGSSSAEGHTGDDAFRSAYASGFGHLNPAMNPNAYKNSTMGADVQNAQGTRNVQTAINTGQQQVGQAQQNTALAQNQAQHGQPFSGGAAPPNKFEQGILASAGHGPFPETAAALAVGPRPASKIGVLAPAQSPNIGVAPTPVASPDLQGMSVSAPPAPAPAPMPTPHVDAIRAANAAPVTIDSFGQPATGQVSPAEAARNAAIFASHNPATQEQIGVYGSTPTQNIGVQQGNQLGHPLLAGLNKGDAATVMAEIQNGANWSRLHPGDPGRDMAWGAEARRNIQEHNMQMQGGNAQMALINQKMNPAFQKMEFMKDAMTTGMTPEMSGSLFDQTLGGGGQELAGPPSPAAPGANPGPKLGPFDARQLASTIVGDNSDPMAAFGRMQAHTGGQNGGPLGAAIAKLLASGPNFADSMAPVEPMHADLNGWPGIVQAGANLLDGRGFQYGSTIDKKRAYQKFMSDQTGRPMPAAPPKAPVNPLLNAIAPGYSVLRKMQGY